MSTTDVLTHMAQQHAWGWTAGQIARWHNVDRTDVQQFIDHGFPVAALPQCQTCEKPFMPANPANVYCSKRCQRRAAKQRANERERAAATPIPCKTCGTEFRPLGNARYCSAGCRPQSRTIGKTVERMCAECGQAFVPKRSDRGRGQYCSDRCRIDANRYTVAPGKAARRKAGETTAIVPSDTKPARTKPMTDTEMAGYLFVLRRELDGKPQTAGDRWWRDAEECERAFRERETVREGVAA